MAAISPIPVVFHADQEHTGLRAAVLLLLIGCTFIFFLLLNSLWPQIAPRRLVDFTFLIACAGSLVLGLAAVWGMEKGLKRIWHSGRTITLNEQGIQVQDGDLPPYTLSWQGNITQLFWRFTLKGYKRGGRERRVPEKWICLAVQVQEGEERVIIYTYSSLKQVEEMMARHGRVPFQEVFPAEVYATDARSRYLSAPSRPDKIPAEVLAGKDGKYWLAEQRRWLEGFELTHEDFEQFISTVTANQESVRS